MADNSLFGHKKKRKESDAAGDGETGKSKPKKARPAPRTTDPAAELARANRQAAKQRPGKDGGAKAADGGGGRGGGGGGGGGTQSEQEAPEHALWARSNPRGFWLWYELNAVVGCPPDADEQDELDLITRSRALVRRMEALARYDELIHRSLGRGPWVHNPCCSVSSTFGLA